MSDELWESLEMQRVAAEPMDPGSIPTPAPRSKGNHGELTPAEQEVVSLLEQLIPLIDRLIEKCSALGYGEGFPEHLNEEYPYANFVWAYGNITEAQRELKTALRRATGRLSAY